MKKESTQIPIILAGAMLFNIIFWKEKLGINVIFLAAFTFICILYLYPDCIKKTKCIFLFAASVFSLIMLICQNTLLSKIDFFITLLLFISFAQYKHRSVIYACGSVVLNYLFSLPNFFRKLSQSNLLKLEASGLIKPIRSLFLPLLISSIFFIIYSFANAVFSNIASSAIDKITTWLSHIFEWLSFTRFSFFLFCAFSICGIVFCLKNNWLLNNELAMTYNLFRKAKKFKKWKEGAFAELLTVISGKSSSGILAIKYELRIGFISLILVNVLLLAINIIDIRYVWFGFTFNTAVSLAASVHEGAGLLIFSIVLAMALLLFFFRGNINFYKENVSLKYLSYLWIIQNSILVFSVFLRDFYYISNFGLAYKRIGLLFFLVFVLTGLITVLLKIALQKTNYFLFTINSWIIVAVIVFASCINWDVLIAGYNLKRKNTIPVDVPFLLSLSDKTLPLIEENKDVLQNKFIDRSTAIDYFNYRKNTFFAAQKEYSWLSWNKSDAEIKRKLITK